MSATNRSKTRAGVLGLMVGCGTALLLVGGLAAQVGQQAAVPSDAAKEAMTKLEELRKRYPFESLTKRLDYETEGAAAFAKLNPPQKVTKETLKRLTAVEETSAFLEKYRPREESLKRLHSNTAEKFIDVRDDFGISRMPHLPVPTTVFLELAAAPSLRCAEVRPAAISIAPEPASLPKQADLSAFQQAGLVDFLNPAGFGYVKDRDHVAGFQGHQFRATPLLNVPPKAPGGQVEPWAVIRLQLVSLLKYERPAVYASDNLPRMDELKGVPTRPLTSFEEKGLKSLREGDDLATESSGDRIRMVGSLRAGKQCLQCHEVKRGDLLGAFSWELQRQPI